jgi:Tfp pilus assembly protein PilV
MSRPGLSVVEVLVALMLVTIALLGMAGSSALALRQVTEGTARRRAVGSAASRLARLAAAGCARATSGTLSDSTTGTREHWIVVAGGGGFASIADTVAWSSPRGPRAITLQSAFPC